MQLQKFMTGIVPANTRSRSVDNFFNRKVKMILGKETIQTEGIKLPLIQKGKENQTIKLYIPGYEADDISIFAYEGQLHIAVMDKEKLMNATKGDDAKIMSYQAIDFRYDLPREIRLKDISANYVSGLLTIHIPHKSKKNGASAREVPIKTLQEG